MTLMACAAAAMAALLAVVAQVPAPDPDVRCNGVLTGDEALATVGEGYAGPAVDEPRPGFTRCEWQGSDSNFGFTFASLRALKDDERSADQEFEFEVAAVEDDTKKREALPGVGVRSAIVVLGAETFLLAVQRADGVARMIAYKVSREKVEAFAKAMATP